MRTTAKNLLPLSAVVAVLGNIGAPTFGFRVVPSIAIKKHGAPIRDNLAARRAQHHHRSAADAATLTLLLSSPDDSTDKNSPEQDMMDQARMEQERRQRREQRGPEQGSPADFVPKPVDPLIASVTRNDGSADEDARTIPVPLFGEITVDGDFIPLVTVAVIGVLGFIFSIVVAFNSRDAIVQEMSKVTVPKMEYKEKVYEEGKCRGLCSDQDKDLDGLRNFMESISGGRTDFDR